jgi:hypothetical protein
MIFIGKPETWKVVYYPAALGSINLGVAFVEADCHHTAMQAFREQYAGQYSTVRSCEKLFG